MRGFFTGRQPGMAKSLLVLGCIGAVAAFYVTSAASGPSTRIFTVQFAPAPAPPLTVNGGTFAQPMTVRVCNTGSSQLGAVDLSVPTVPTAFSISSVGALPGSGSTSSPTGISLRNLSLNSGACTPVVTFAADVPCPEGSYQWGAAGRQQGDFSGQSFTLDEGNSNRVTAVAKACTLVFTVEPANSEKGFVITDVPYDIQENDPAIGSFVTVEAQNAANELVPSADDLVTLDVTGTFTSSGAFLHNSKALSGGIAAFDAFASGATGTGFQATATAPGYFDSDPSDLFDVVLDGLQCPGQGQSCHVQTPPGSSVASADTTGTDENDSNGIGLLDYSAGAFQIPEDVCDAVDGTSFEPIETSQGFFMSVHIAGGSTPYYTIKMIFDKSVTQFIPENGNTIGACFGAQRYNTVTGAKIPCTDAPSDGFPTLNSPDPDPNNAFTAVCDPDTELYWGLLLNAPTGQNTCAAPLTYPVVMKRNKSGKPGSFTITLCKPPPWDEKGGFG